jgi:hypothetical protein
VRKIIGEREREREIKLVRKIKGERELLCESAGESWCETKIK